jgi:hypothetical protein
MTCGGDGDRCSCQSFVSLDFSVLPISAFGVLVSNIYDDEAGRPSYPASGVSPVNNKFNDFTCARLLVWTTHRNIKVFPVIVHAQIMFSAHVHHVLS